jgi:hypothetical protein
LHAITEPGRPPMEGLKRPPTGIIDNRHSLGMSLRELSKLGADVHVTTR